MDTRRLLLFLLLSFSFVMIWTRIFPPPVPPKPTEQPDQAIATLEEEPADTPSDSNADNATATAADAPGIVTYESRRVTLGSTAVNSGYAFEVELSSMGACITSVRLADPRMNDLEHRDEQVKVLGNNLSDHATFRTSVAEIDRQLNEDQPGMNLESVDWKLQSIETDAVVFTYTSPNGALEVEKGFRIQRLKEDQEAPLRTDTAAYTIECRLQVRNRSAQEQPVQYDLTGPCGVILENAEHTRKYRDIKLEFLEGGDSDVFSASEVQSLWQEARQSTATEEAAADFVRQGEEKWTQPVRYAGVDVQFFAALLVPHDDRPIEQQVATPQIDAIWPVLVEADRNSSLADVTFQMRSRIKNLQPAGQQGDTLNHGYSLFVGPKHGSLLDPPPLQAEKVLDYGSWFGFIARGMHSILSMLHGIGMPYWLAIISLTVIVRCCLFPLSRKQAISAARMKELQPKINELKLKYGEDKEKMAKAQMELWRKYDINPLGGCLPLFFQFPVFIGLYTCLNTAVDLRLSEFLWIDNLAAPDALFRMPFALPYLGSDFNILPCINVVLFLIQQKLFMPPPTDEQQEMQHKMMNMMTVFFAAMFWHVPAGLCIYFVASSLWSIGERKLLSSDTIKGKGATAEPNDSDASGTNGKPHRKKDRDDTSDPNRKKGFFERLMEAAEQAKEQAEQDRGKGGRGTARKSSGKDGKGKGSKGRKR